MPFSFADDVLWRKVANPEVADNAYEAAGYEKKVLPAGWRLKPGKAAFKVDTIWERDVEIILRDGTKTRADIFRPKEDDAVPALIAWSPYGKSAYRLGGFYPLEFIPGRVGVPADGISGYEKFEAPDPAEWTARGYAIVNPDIRGAYDSEGDLQHFGSVEADDGHDVIEHVASLEWCNGSVALAGNSWLGIAQWFIAATRPPHLKCIAPLEGASDLYREVVCRGGIPQPTFWDFLSDTQRGRNRQEDIVGMLKKYPLMNEYWKDKRAQIERINVPAYVLASYSTCFHTFGSFRGYMEIPHEEKWLRVHATQEWHDLYQKSTSDDLQRFFDRYLKGVENGWEQTSKARVSVLTYDETPIINKPFVEWPIPRTTNRTLYLAESGKLTECAPHATRTIHYQSDVPFLSMGEDTEEVSFTYTFPEPCLVVGSARAKLYVSCQDADVDYDMDVFVQIRKADNSGTLLQHLNIPRQDREQCEMPEPVDPVNPLIYLGPSGCLRASHRRLDEKLSTPYWPEHDYTRQQLLKPGEVVELEIGLWQTCIAFAAGEKLVFKVAGHNMTLAEYPDLRGNVPNYNKGEHTVYLGGEYQSYLIIPTVQA